MNKTLLTLILAIILQASVQAGTPAVLEVFVLSDQRDAITGLDVMEERGIRVVIHVVDDLHLAEGALSARLPKGVDAAKAAAGDVIRSITPEDEQRFVAAWFALQRAHRFNIHSAPAVVFDSSSVAYGVTQLEQALSIWREVHE